MSLNHPIIGIIGAGAVGCYYGGRLAQHGKNVHLLLRSEFDRVSKNGLHVKSADGDFDLYPPALQIYREVRDMPQCDLVIITLKTTANEFYQPLISPLLKEDTIVLTLQNGLGNEDQLAELFGAGRILGGIAFVCINRLEDGTIHHSDHGLIKIGEYRGKISPRLRQLAELFNTSGVKCQVIDDLARGRWEKLIWNIPFNGLGALLGLTTDKLVNNEQGLMLVRTIMGEVIKIAASCEISFSPQIIEEKVKQTLSMGAYKTSSQVDMEYFKPIEIKAIFRNPLIIGHSHGIVTPYLEMLYNQLCMVENMHRFDDGRVKLA